MAESSVATYENYTSNMTPTSGRNVRLVVMHTLETPDSEGRARWAAEYFKTVQASAHYIVDNKDIVQGVAEWNMAWAAPGANEDGIQVEQAGYAGQNTSQWHDAYSQKVIDNSAKLVADICKRNGIPVRYLNGSQVAAGQAGITGHVDVNNAYGQSDHWDPGPAWPWAEFIQKVEHYYNGGKSSTVDTTAAIQTTTTTMMKPVEATITQNFGDNATDYNVGGGHTGTDFAVSVGTPVKAMADGKVLWADWANNLPTSSWADRWFLSGGNYGGVTTSGGIEVVLDHGSYLSVYAHLNETALNVGDTVKKGQVIAKSGMTGTATGPHLHWEVLPKPLNYQRDSWSYGRVNAVQYVKDNAKTTTTKTVTQSELEELADWIVMNEARAKEIIKAAVGEKLEQYRGWFEQRSWNAIQQNKNLLHAQAFQASKDALNSQLPKVNVGDGKQKTSVAAEAAWKNYNDNQFNQKLDDIIQRLSVLEGK